MRVFKVILYFLMGIVLMAVAALGALIFVDPTAYRNQIESRARAAFGREVRIAGSIHLKRSLRPQIVVEDISIGNPEWAKGPHFVTAEKVGLQVALFPLLRGDLRVLDVFFSGVNLFLEESPDGEKNFFFGSRDGRQRTGLLPAIERLQINSSLVTYKKSDGNSRHLTIDTARLWNIPGEPERIEAQGSTKDMPFTIVLSADSAAELSSPQNPWSMQLDINAPDMSLTIAGWMDDALKWNQGEYSIKLGGDHVDSLETLFDLDLPTIGPFELSAKVNKIKRSSRVTDIAARLKGTPRIPTIIILDGEASYDQDNPLQLALQGQFGEDQFTLSVKSTQSLKDASQHKSWPIDAQIHLADLSLNIESEMSPAHVKEYLEFRTRIQGNSLNTLSRLLDTELPEAGPFQLLFHTRIAAGKYTFSDLKGDIEHLGFWQNFRIDGGNASINSDESILVSLDGLVDDLPLSISLERGPRTLIKAGQKSWPLLVDASASGSTIMGEGTVVTAENGTILQIASRISGDRSDVLGTLAGVSVPAIGKFDVHAEITSDGEIHEIDNLRAQIGNNHLSGRLRWEGKMQRPVLSGTLFAESLSFNDSEMSSIPTSNGTKNGLLDTPFNLEVLNAFDAQLDITVKNVANSTIPVSDIGSMVTLISGKLSAPFRTNLAGVPIEGQVQLRRNNNTSEVLFNATAEKIDAGSTLRQMNVSDFITGTADSLQLKASSTGETLRSLFERAAFTLQLKPANLSYPLQVAGQTLDFTFSSVELTARTGEPLTAIFEGMLNGTPFNGDISTTNLVEIQKANVPLPLRLTIKKADLDFKAEGDF